MKHDRSLRRIDDEKNLFKNKQIEIDKLKKEIERIQEEKIKLEKIIFQYQPHLNLLTQVNLRIFLKEF
jgi:predicted  nucleic acid-binding Zn-ribbon protein